MRSGAPEPAVLRVAVEADDARVAAGLRELLGSDSGVAVVDGPVADVVVVELAATAGPGAGVRISELARQRPVVVLGFDHDARQSVAELPNVTFVDKLDVGSELLLALHRAAPRRTAAAVVPLGWPRTVLLAAAVFVGPWAFWGSAIAEAHGLIGWRLPQGLALWSIVPLLLTAVVATSGRAGLRDLAARVGRFRVPGPVYAVALSVPLAIAGTTAAIVTAAGGTVPIGELLSLPAALVYLAYGTGLFLLTEEAAWRGALLPRIQGRLGAGRASLVVGLVWAAWHLPLLATPGESDRGLPVPPFLALIVATSVLMTALVNVARGSVVVAALFHASFDACYSWFGVVGEEHAMLWVAAAVTALVATALLALTRGGLFERPEDGPWPRSRTRSAHRMGSPVPASQR